LEGAEIWIDSFNSFTPQEYKIIKSLIYKSKRVTIALTVKDIQISYGNLEITDYFFETKNTINTVSRLASELGVTIDKPTVITTPNRFLNNEELKHLEANYFNHYNNKYTKQVETIFITETENIHHEVNDIACKIIDLIRYENYKFSDISILTGDISAYKKILESTLSKYDIKYFIDTKEDILNHPLTELIMSAVEIVASNFSYEPIFRFLKTNMTPLKSEQIYKLENYVLAYGIKAQKWKLDEWTYGFENTTFDKDEINILRGEVNLFLKPLVECIGGAKKATVKVISTKIFEMLKFLKVTSTLNDWLLQMENEHNYIMASRHNAIWTNIVNLFEKMVEILGEEQFNAKQFTKILDSGFRSVESASIPQVQDKVTIGDFERSRFPKTLAMFIIGVNEGIIPKTKQEEGFFSDDEKLQLVTKGITLSKDSNQKSYEEQFIIYSAITKAENYLYFSYNTGNLEGKGIKPSRLIGTLQNIFPEIKISDGSIINISLPKAMFKDMGNILRNYVKENKIDDINKDLYCQTVRQ
jgi:ATP-dependent helicase/nuclease subunit B